MVNDDFDKDVDNEFAEEFDFVEDDTVKSVDTKTTTQTTTTTTKASGSGSKLPLLIILIVAAVGGYYGYKMMTAPPEATADTSATPAPAPESPDQTMQPAPDAAPMPSTPTDNSVDFHSNPPIPVPPAPPPAMTPQDDQLSNALPPQQPKNYEQMQKVIQGKNTKAAIPDEINATLDSISEEMTLNVNQIKNLEATITSLASSVAQLNKSISAMDNRVLGLTETVDGLAQDLSNVKRIMNDEDIDLTSSNKVKYSNKNQTKPLGGSTPEYSVHAIIPGRAWLKSSSGQILTVTEGDKVGDYGTVAVIDAANGIVRTSSGITFR